MVCHEFVVSCWPGLQLHVKSQLGKNLLPHSLMCLSGLSSSWLWGRDLQFHTDCWLKAFLSVLIHGPLHRTDHNMTAYFPQNGTESERKHPRRKSWSSYNLVSEVTSHHFCGILFLGSKSVSLATDYT